MPNIKSAKKKLRKDTRRTSINDAYKKKEAETLQNKFKMKISLENKKVIIVDDGVATGTTAICAAMYAKNQKAEEIILATPVIGQETLRNIQKYFDRIIPLKIVNSLTSVSQFYKYFPQVENEEVIEILNRK